MDVTAIRQSYFYSLDIEVLIHDRVQQLSRMNIHNDKRIGLDVYIGFELDPDSHKGNGSLRC